LLNSSISNGPGEEAVHGRWVGEGVTYNDLLLRDGRTPISDSVLSSLVRANINILTTKVTKYGQMTNSATEIVLINSDSDSLAALYQARVILNRVVPYALPLSHSAHTGDKKWITARISSFRSTEWRR